MDNYKNSNKFSSPIINGKLVSDNSFNKVSVLSPSFQYGLTVFEGIRAYINDQGDLVPFLLDEHIKRLIDSSKLLGIKLNFSISDIKDDIKLILKAKNQTQDIYIKYIICFLGEGSWYSSNDPDRVCFSYLSPTTLRGRKPEYLTASFTSINRISSNIISPRIKCGANYINSRMGVLDVNDISSYSKIPIFIDNNGFVSETSGACIFIIKNNQIITPSISSSVLESITRGYILKSLAQKLNQFIFKEEFIDRWDILNADAVFIVGTNVEIKGIKAIDHIEYKTNNDVFLSIFEQFKDIIK